MIASRQNILVALAALTFWYSLSFVGLPGVIDSWFKEDVIWVLFALSIWAPLVVGLWSHWKRHNYTDWMITGVTGIWMTMALNEHWRWFFIKPTPEKLESYYKFFDTWYLLPKLTDRIVPDGYHTILHALILIPLAISLSRLLARLRRR